MSALRAWRVTAAIAFRAWPAGAVGRVVITVVVYVCSGLLPGLALRAVLDDGGAGWMVVLAVSAVVPLATGSVWEWLQRGMMLRSGQAATHAVMAAALAPAGIEHLESARYADAMEVIRVNNRTPALLFDWMAIAAGGVIGVGASVAVLAGVHPLLLVPVAAAGGLGVVHAATRRRTLVYLDGAVPGQRLARRLAEIGTSPGAAKEVRTLGLSSWLVDRHHQEVDAVTRRLVRGERGPVLASAAAGVMQALLLGLGVAWLARLSATGRASTGDLALGVVVVRSAVEQAAAIGMTMGSDLARNTHVARRYLWLLDYRPELAVPENPAPMPATLRSGICLDDVTFCYGAARPALESVSVTLPAGATVALVGDNGAGKSTLVKLLCRYYDPQQGRITVDGTDLRQLDLDGWRAATTGAFQDFVRFKFLAGEAVGIGDLAMAGDAGWVAAVAASGGAAPFLERLPLGYATQLGREYPAGAELSEGQWQKVALSRALMRDHPLLVVLDEPTACLDARAEHHTFESYAAQAASGRQRGAITLLVSHRFSTVAMADLIVVLDRGRVVEVGTHAQLVAVRGQYAELYQLQADRYR